MSRIMTARCRAPKPSIIPSAVARDLKTRAPRVDPSRTLTAPNKPLWSSNSTSDVSSLLAGAPDLSRPARSNRTQRSDARTNPVARRHRARHDPSRSEICRGRSHSADTPQGSQMRLSRLRASHGRLGFDPEAQTAFTVSHVFPSHKGDRRRTCAREDPFTLGTWYQTGGQEASRTSGESEGARNQAPCRIRNIRSDSPGTDHGRIFPPKVSPTARPA